MSSHSVGSSSCLHDSSPPKVFISAKSSDKFYVGEGHTAFTRAVQEIAQSAFTFVVSTRTNHQGGHTTINSYIYSPELKKVFQRSSVTQFQDGSFEKYEFCFVPQLKACKLVQQTHISSTGDLKFQRWSYQSEVAQMLPPNATHSVTNKDMKGVWFRQPGCLSPKFVPAACLSNKRTTEEGTWQIVPALGHEQAFLKKGIRQVHCVRPKFAITFEGEFAYVPDYKGLSPNTMLVRGRMHNPKTQMIVEGDFEFCTHIQKVRLKKGTRTLNDTVETGDWKYIPDLKDHALVKGSKTINGVTETGQFAYDPETRTMKLA